MQKVSESHTQSKKCDFGANNALEYAYWPSALACAVSEPFQQYSVTQPQDSKMEGDPALYKTCVHQVNCEKAYLACGSDAMTVVVSIIVTITALYGNRQENDGTFR